MVYMILREASITFHFKKLEGVWMFLFFCFGKKLKCSGSISSGAGQQISYWSRGDKPADGHWDILC